jgi:hypothetical protein
LIPAIKEQHGTAGHRVGSERFHLAMPTAVQMRRSIPAPGRGMVRNPRRL